MNEIRASSQSNHCPEWDLLLSFSQKNWPEKIRQLLATEGVPPDHSNAIGQTALHIAALWGHGKYHQDSAGDRLVAMLSTLVVWTDERVAGGQTGRC
jgi:ankyrin repeat protein